MRTMAEIPLFPLPTVLFPGGRLPLQIFEARYLDMLKRCMSNGSGFGVVMIEDGHQVLSDAEQQLPVVCHQGTYCRVIDFDENSKGLLFIVVEGEAKFVIRDQYERPDRLMMADVEYLDPEGECPLPEHQEHMAAILQSLMEHDQVARLGYEVDLTAAGAVGARLTELLPCTNQLKQQLLEMKDPLARINELEKVIVDLQSQEGS